MTSHSLVEYTVTWCLKVRTVEQVLWKHPLLHNGLLKHVCTAMNMHITADKLFAEMSSNQSNTMLYKESK
jgi:hypothetical protein